MRLLLLSGSTRSGSTNRALLRTVAVVAPRIYGDLWPGLKRLPQFDPDDDLEPLPVDVADLRARIAVADAVLICTPEYAGALPGAFKNLLDWTIGGTETGGKPFAWVNASGRPDGAAGAHAELRTVLAYTDATIVDAACTRIPVARSAIGDDGTVTDVAVRTALVACLETLVAQVAGRP